MNKRIQDSNTLKNIVSIYKRQNKNIVFVNGCFDLFHAGHLSLLKEAKSKGDILIIGLNSDSSIKKIKGDGRPIIAEEDRLSILESLIYVDNITIFNESTPLELIEIIKPDIIVKEAEYKNKRLAIEEQACIEKYNCEIYYYEKSKNISTTKIIEKISDISQKKRKLVDE